MYKNVDIVIVGGGPAGLSAAEYAAGDGLCVIVLERSKEIGYPVHTSGGSWIEELEALGIPETMYHKIYDAEFCSPSNAHTLHYDEPVVCVMDVRAVYQHLAIRASSKGVEIFVDASVRAPIVENGQIAGVAVDIHGVRSEIRAKIVIDASGASSLIARKMGIVPKFDSYGIGAEYELYTETWDQNKVTFMLGSAIAPAGYGWIFPCGENRVRIGSGVIYPNIKESPLKLLDAFLADNNNRLTRQLMPFSRLEFHQGIVPNIGVVETSVSDGLIVVGDAACQVSGVAGEGIRYAIDIGRMAGATAKKAVTGKDVSRKSLQEYDRMWRKKYEKVFKYGHMLNDKFRDYKDADWDRRVSDLPNMDAVAFADVLRGNLKTTDMIKAAMKSPKLMMKGITKIVRKL